jgi:hypothetical protein
MYAFEVHTVDPRSTGPRSAGKLAVRTDFKIWSELCLQTGACSTRKLLLSEFFWPSGTAIQMTVQIYLVVSYLSEHDGYASLAGSIEICLLVVDYVWYACTGNPTSLHAAKASSSSLELEIPRLNVSSRYL